MDNVYNCNDILPCWVCTNHGGAFSNHNMVMRSGVSPPLHSPAVCHLVCHPLVSRHTVLCVSPLTLTLPSHTELCAHTSLHTLPHCCQPCVLMATDALHTAGCVALPSPEHPQWLHVMHVREEQSNKYLHTHTQKHTGGNNHGS